MTLDINNLAPISVSVYTRHEHFRQCIESLAANSLAKHSKLYIFSDAPKSGDEDGVRLVREYAEKITGFREVILRFQTSNGYLRNMREARERPITDHGKIIRLEDDIVVAPGFLNFINSALEFYKDDPSILNVTGYCPPIKIPKTHHEDFFVLPRPSAWGIGYDSRMLKVISQPIDVEKYRQYKDKDVLKQTGLDVPNMVEKEVAGHIHAGDVRAMFYQLTNNQYTIYPRESLVQNIGHDGSGIHCGVSIKFQHEKLWGKLDGFLFSTEYDLDSDIMQANYKFRSPSLLSRIAAKAKRTIVKMMD